MLTMTPSSANIKADIRRANDKFESIYAAGDAAGMASLYTEKGILLPPGSQPVTGQEAIQNFWQMVMDMGVKTVKLDSVEIEQHNDTAIEQGKAVLSSADGQLLDECKYIVVWKQVNSQWKLNQDIWNTSLAPR